jgi:hypothetical protein
MDSNSIIGQEVILTLKRVKGQKARVRGIVQSTAKELAFVSCGDQIVVYPLSRLLNGNGQPIAGSKK